MTDFNFSDVSAYKSEMPFKQDPSFCRPHGNSLKSFLVVPPSVGPGES